jgi:hypothetical protein
MSLTNFPAGILATPNIGGSSFAGWFNRNVWFVDGTLGSDGNNGGHDTPFKTIQKAINVSKSQDTIYIRTLAPDTDASDPGQYVENLSIPFAKHGLQLIGVSASGTKMPYGGPKIKNASAGALLTVLASNVHLENLQFNCTRNSGTYGILLDGIAGYATKAGSVGFTIVNCMIKNASATYGGINVVGGYGGVISNCTFQICEKAVWLSSNTLPSNGHTVEYCNFKSNNGVAVAEHLTIVAGAHTDISVTDCTFDIATSFLSCGANNQGIVARCQFNDLVATLANSTGKVKMPVGTMTCVGCDGGVGLNVIQSQA